MSNADNRPDYRKMYEIACQYFNKKKQHFASGPTDETFFTLRVFESAKEIIKKIKKKVNKQEVLTATIFHDIGKSGLKIKKIFAKNGWANNSEKEWNEEWHKHPSMSAKLAKPWLKKMGHSKEFIGRVCYLIENHDKRRMKSEKSLELKIVQDADYIGDTGFSGFVRPFCWSGKYKRSIISQIQYMKENKNSRLNLNEINLEISKKIIKKNSLLEKSLKKEMATLIKSELL